MSFDIPSCNISNTNRTTLGKMLIITLKYYPIVQSIGILINNTCYVLGIWAKLCYILDFIIGNSLITTILLLIGSYTFKFCGWHRALIIGNFMSILLGYANYLFIHNNPFIKDYVITYVVVSITLLVALFYKFIIKR